MDEQIWYYASGSEQKGPVSEAELSALIANSSVGADTLVWRSGMGDWMRAADALPVSLRPSEWARTAPPPRAQAVTAGASGSQGPGTTAHPTQFMDAVKTCFNKYASFRGRARRPEFWYFVLFNFLANIVLGFADFAIFGMDNGIAPIGTIYSLAVLVPSLAVTARRLHDIGRSGWWQLLILVPIVGIIILIIWYVRKGDDRANEYGPA